MNLNPRITRIKELLGLEERRAELQQQLDNLFQQMSSLKDTLFDDNNRAQSSASTAKSTPSAPARGRGRPRGRTPRGELKSQIVAALTAAGNAGVRVTELAKSLGIKAVNVHSWFHSALPRYPQIKKMDRGQYRLDGNLGGGTSSGGGASRPSALVSRKAPAAYGRPKGRSRGRTRRGELSQRILGELTSAGAKGVNVRELSDKIGTPYKNIYIWFATTGKKNPKIKKLAPATYKLGA